MLYKKKLAPFSEEDFKNPSSEYRGAPFWAWNCKMEESDVANMTEMFGEMGMGGAHLHSRTGMNLPYLKETFMDRVKQACDCAREKDMLVWLYDEDRWPSGYGGGYITSDDRYRTRIMIWSPEPLGDVWEQNLWNVVANGKCTRSNNRRLLGMYYVELDEENWLKSYRQVSEEEAKDLDPDNIWYVYMEISGDNQWFNGQAYTNNLDPETIKKFIEVTHEEYYKAVGKDFGTLIPAIFTDEPQYPFMEVRKLAAEREMFSVPYTDDFPDTYKAAYGEDLMEHLPEVFFDRKDGYSVTRYRYHDHLTERFVQAYADQIGDWCEKHNIALTGHVMREASLKLQTEAVGETMRFYRSMQLPGIDMLAWRTEYNTAKQCQSAVHQFGREGMLSELYGVTNWDFDFRGHKLLGDWQAALGVTIRVPHLSWTSMEGEAKRDYPASIGYQSPWYKEYKLVEDYFARVNTAMTRGKCLINLGVLHPVESYWLCHGSDEKTGTLRQELDDAFDMITKWLIGDAKDFDLIAESLVKELYKGSADGKVNVGEMQYSTILAPNMLTMRSDTLHMLREFKQAGGRVVFTGYTPEYLDGMPNEEVKAFVKECEWVPFVKNRILQTLDGISDLEILGENGTHTDNLITQTRQDNEERWIFVAHKPPIGGLDQIIGAEAYTTNCPRSVLRRQDRVDVQKLIIKVKGTWNIKIYDAWNAVTKDTECVYKNGYTYLYTEMYAQDSLLLRLTPAKEVKEAAKLAAGWTKKKENETEITVPHEVDVTLSEPNVFLLDMAEYAFDDEDWKGREEILRIDNLFRDRLGLKYRMEAFPQPWVLKEEVEDEHTLRLRFTIPSEIEAESVDLALEHPTDCEIVWNGETVSNVPVGRYVDRDIFRVTLGKLCKGENTLFISMPFKQKTNVEAMYLLGDFGVSAAGDSAKIIEPIRKMHFGDWVLEGLPFYGGNVTYHIPVEGNGNPFKVSLNKFRNPVMKVELDGKKQGMIAISPYEVTTEPVEKGMHMLDLTVYGNRFNTFGGLHNTDGGEYVYCSPNFWRSTGSFWAYEYQFRATGPLMAPRILEVK